MSNHMVKRSIPLGRELQLLDTQGVTFWVHHFYGDMGMDMDSPNSILVYYYDKLALVLDNLNHKAGGNTLRVGDEFVVTDRIHRRRSHFVCISRLGVKWDDNFSLIESVAGGSAMQGLGVTEYDMYADYDGLRPSWLSENPPLGVETMVDMWSNGWPLNGTPFGGIDL